MCELYLELKLLVQHTQLPDATPRIKGQSAPFWWCKVSRYLSHWTSLVA